MKSQKGKNIKNLHCEELYIPGSNGSEKIRVRIFRPKSYEGDLVGMLYNHGGGYMVSIPETKIPLFQKYIQTKPCVIIAPDYCKSIKHPFPAGFNDCYDTLLWMKENATSLGINPSKFIVAGDSAGGGLTAAIAQKAADTGDVNIAFQIPLYPMIDYRQQTESAKNMRSVPVWDSVNNAIGWKYYLKNIEENVPAYASPAINQNYTGFPPTITFVGTIDTFRDETINYVENLKKFNVPVKFQLFKGAFHGFEQFNSTISKRANQFHLAAFAEYFEKYAV